jgi:hypothetical protein
MRIARDGLRTDQKLQLARFCRRNAHNAFAGPERVVRSWEPLVKHWRFNIDRHAAASFGAKSERI